MGKKKANVRLEVGEAYVVATVEQLDHVISTYRTLAERLDTEEDKQAWRDLADHFAAWVLETINLGEAEDSDDWH